MNQEHPISRFAANHGLTHDDLVIAARKVDRTAADLENIDSDYVYAFGGVDEFRNEEERWLEQFRLSSEHVIFFSWKEPGAWLLVAEPYKRRGVATFALRFQSFESALEQSYVLSMTGEFTGRRSREGQTPKRQKSGAKR